MFVCFSLTPLKWRLLIAKTWKDDFPWGVNGYRLKTFGLGHPSSEKPKIPLITPMLAESAQVKGMELTYESRLLML